MLYLLAACLPAVLGLWFLARRQKAKIDSLKRAADEQNRALEELRDAYRGLEAVGPLRELGQSTMFINHEIKNYMMVISGYAMLLQRSRTISEKDRAMVDNIAQSATKLQEFNVSVLEQAKSKITHENIEVDLVQKIKACVDTNFGAAAAKFSISCGVPADGAGGGAVLVNGSPDKLERAFANAFRNSLEAGAEKISAKVYIYNHTTLIVIEDDGAGCDAADFPNIFTTFFSTKRDMGLGLCTIRSTVETHGGNISIYSKNLSGRDERGLSMQIAIPASRKNPHAAEKSELLLLKDGLEGTDDIQRVLKNMKIIPHMAEWLKDVESAPRSSSIGLTILAAPKHTDALIASPGSNPGTRVLTVEKTNAGALIVKAPGGNSADLFTEEYIINHLSA
jgi:signal transduction histidine kinase